MAARRVPQVCPGTGESRRKSSSRRESETFGCSEHKGVSSRHVSERRKKLGRVVQPETVRCVDHTTGEEVRTFSALPGGDRDEGSRPRPMPRPGGQSNVFVIEESLHNPSSGVPNPDSTRHWSGDSSVAGPEDSMDVDFDAGAEPVLVRRGRADQTDMEVCPDTTGECHNCDAVEILGWYATVGGIRTEPIQMQECEMFRRHHKHEKSSMQIVISTTTSHKAKRVVTREYADAMCVPEHYPAHER